MQDFYWGCSTTYCFGKGVSARVGEELASRGMTKVLVVYGQGSVERSGLLALVEESLTQAGVSFVKLGGVRPNPEVSLVRQGVALAQEQKLDGILAVGGGSVIDCSKAISFGFYYQGDVWDFFAKKEVVTQTLPLACIVTIPAAGSESSASCVISNDELGLKRGVSSELFRPVLALMDPGLTCTLPAYQTAAGATDMIAHICERWFSGVDAVPVTDATAAGLIKTIMSQTFLCLEDPNNYDARANLMWAGTLAHNGIAGLGRNLSFRGRAGGWESHALEHELSALNPAITHGAGLAVMLPAWMRYVWRENPQRFLDFGQQVFGVNPQGEDEKDIEFAVKTTIQKLQCFFKEIGMPQSLKELGIASENIPALLITLEQNKGAEFGAFKRLTMEDARAIYLSAL